jgi:hypothetical protein
VRKVRQVLKVFKVTPDRRVIRERPGLKAKLEPKVFKVTPVCKASPEL